MVCNNPLSAVIRIRVIASQPGLDADNERCPTANLKGPDIILSICPSSEDDRTLICRGARRGHNGQNCSERQTFRVSEDGVEVRRARQAVALWITMARRTTRLILSLRKLDLSYTNKMDQ